MKIQNQTERKIVAYEMKIQICLIIVVFLNLSNEYLVDASTDSTPNISTINNTKIEYRIPEIAIPLLFNIILHLLTLLIL